MTHRQYLFLAPLALAAACGDDGGGGVTADALLVDAEFNGAPACGLAELYLSDAEHECGLGPPGQPAPMCRWRLEFGTGAADQFLWQYSDIGDSGTYSCVGGRLIARTAGGRDIEAEFSAGSPSLTWDGVPYTRVLPVDAGAP
jgi:hypothetical protein